uniref:Uncharacterized protein n=1 Tax=Rhodopseudomonas palustris (strain BisA53) TaxID=316055 RepID=Q07MB3_RHOP5
MPHWRGWLVALGHMQAVSMQRPMLQPLGFTKLPLRQFASIAAVRGFNLKEMLAHLRVPSILAQNVLEELHDVVRHQLPPGPRALR